MEIINKISLIIGSIGVLVIVWGAIVSAFELLIEESKRFAGKNLYAERNRIRHYFSFYLLMGLEYMIGADIIRTLIRPTLQELAVLGAMVAIRTVTSYFLNKEMEQYHKGE
jgi:uncharacterized membrane protein